MFEEIYIISEISKVIWENTIYKYEVNAHQWFYRKKDLYLKTSTLPETVQIMLWDQEIIWRIAYIF